MRAPARAFASVVWMVAVSLAGCVALFGVVGCSAGPRPDAQVARAVEEHARRRLETIVLASADDELPLALPVAGRAVVDGSLAPAPQPLASVPGAGVPDRYFV